MSNSNPVSDFAIAHQEITQYLSDQVARVAPEKRPITQRKAKYHDKNRAKRHDVQQWVYRRTGLNSSKEIKAALKTLGKKLDLRLTAAWLEINANWVEAISVQNLPLSLPIANSLFKKGDRVSLINYPANLAHLEQWSPFALSSIEGNIARLDFVAVPILISNLELVA